MARPLRYQTVDSWLLAQLHRLNLKYDNYHLNTGEEGDAKSTWSRIVARRLDGLMRTPTALVQLTKGGPRVPISSVWRAAFPVPPPMDGPPNLGNICFGQDQLLLTLATLPLCGIAIGDEIEGHKRLAMHGHRQVLLDHTKEARFYRHNVWLNYPHPDQFERDLFRTRLKWWEHQDSRGNVVIRERPRGKIQFDQGAEMSVLVKWPIVAQFPWSNKNDPWETAYEAKKEKRGRERMAARLKALGAVPEEPMAEPRSTRMPPGLLDMVLAESKRL
jgi:hypothetical protein